MSWPDFIFAQSRITSLVVHLNCEPNTKERWVATYPDGSTKRSRWRSDLYNERDQLELTEAARENW